MATLQGKYVVDAKSVIKIPATQGITTSEPPSTYSINYTNVYGEPFVALSCFNVIGVGTAIVYFGKEGSLWGPSLASGKFDQSALGCQILDFGDEPQTIEDIFYDAVLSYILVPFEDNQYVDGTGLAAIVDKTKAQQKEDVLSVANSILPNMTVIKEYYKTDPVTDSGEFTTDASVLFLCVTPSSTSTQIFLTVPISTIAQNSNIVVSAPDNGRITYFKVQRYTTQLQITAIDCYNDNAVQQSSTGKINAIYGMKVGG